MDTILQDGPAFAGIEDTTELSPLPIKDDINPAALASVKQTYGEAKPRYYVMMVGGGVPTRPHGSRYWAEQEAKRLAAKFPDQTFHVLKVKASFSASKHQIECEMARTKLKLGQQVSISPFHFRNPNESGEIIGFTQRGSVEIKLASGAVYAFAPTTIYVEGLPAYGIAVAPEQVPGG